MIGEIHKKNHHPGKLISEEVEKWNFKWNEYAEDEDGEELDLSETYWYYYVVEGNSPLYIMLRKDDGSIFQYHKRKSGYFSTTFCDKNDKSIDAKKFFEENSKLGKLIERCSEDYDGSSQWHNDMKNALEKQEKHRKELEAEEYKEYLEKQKKELEELKRKFKTDDRGYLIVESEELLLDMLKFSGNLSGMIYPGYVFAFENKHGSACHFPSVGEDLEIEEIDLSKMTGSIKYFLASSKIKKIQKVILPKQADAEGLFQGASNLEEIGQIVRFDDVKSAKQMFYLCKKLARFPKMSTSSLENATSMFNGCEAMTQIPNYDFSKVTSTKNMFYGSGLKSIHDIAFPNASKSKYENSIYGDYGNKMFSHCKSLALVKNLIYGGGNADYMFSMCDSLESVEGVDLPFVKSTKSMFRGCSLLSHVSELKFGDGQVYSAEAMFMDCKSLQNPHLVIDLSKINITKSIFDGCPPITGSMSRLSGIQLIPFEEALFDTIDYLEIDFNDKNFLEQAMDYSRKKTSIKKVNHMKVSLGGFISDGYITGNKQIAKILEIDEIGELVIDDPKNVGKEHSTCSAFGEMNNLKKIGKITSNCFCLNRMFVNCKNLTYVGEIDFSQVPPEGKCESIFSDCRKLEQIRIFKFGGQDLSKAFYNCKALVTVSLDAPNLKDITAVFSYCHNLKRVNGLDFSTLEKAPYAFRECKLIQAEEIDLSNIEDASGMFDCSGFSDIKKIKLPALDSRGIFSMCNNLIHVGEIDFNHSSRATELFSNCEKLKSVDKFTNFENLKNINKIFLYCTSLETIPPFDGEKLEQILSAFKGCHNLKRVEFLKLTSNLKECSEAFSFTSKLAEVRNLELNFDFSYNRSYVFEKSNLENQYGPNGEKLIHSVKESLISDLFE